jgi:hypothetical protein
LNNIYIYLINNMNTDTKLRADREMNKNPVLGYSK